MTWLLIVGWVALMATVTAASASADDWTEDHASALGEELGDDEAWSNFAVSPRTSRFG